MTSSNLPGLIEQLTQAAVYPHPVESVRLVQTHISYVLIAGDFVYKIKKPVNFGFLDFTTLDKRRFFCQEELRLNQRLCPTIYLDVLGLRQKGGAVTFSTDLAGAEELAVRMARMPEERLMPHIIRDQRLTAAMLDDIVRILVPFYQQADGGERIQGFGTASAVAVNVLENFEQTAGFVGCAALSQARFDTIGAYARGVLAQEAFFTERIAAGRIRDGHGDLYSANICLADTIHIFDCIEFNERFRFCDVASDVAFLAMDLDFHGLDTLSRHFVTRFAAASADDGLAARLNFYKCYRAYVRGKIGLFTANAPEVDETTRTRSLAQAADYFALAERYAREG